MPLSRIRTAGAAACARACGPAAAVPPSRVERATRKARALRTLAASQKPARARTLDFAFCCPAAPVRLVPRDQSDVSDRHPEGPRRTATRGRDSRRRARSREAWDAAGQHCKIRAPTQFYPRHAKYRPGPYRHQTGPFLTDRILSNLPGEHHEDAQDIR